SEKQGVGSSILPLATNMLILFKKLYNFILLKKVPKKTKKNFIKLSEQYEKDIRKFLLSSYFTKNQKIENDDLEDHINRRIVVSRSKIIPWIMKTLELKNKKVLEVGSGTGSSSITFAEQGAAVTGIDVDNNSIIVARHRAQMLDLDIEFLELSGTEIHKLNQSFDVVIYYAALEHMTIEERIESLQQAFSLLSKNGYLIIIEAPNRLWIEDTHTSELPFFQWLPDNLAYLYSKFSKKPSYNSEYLDSEFLKLDEFHRRGRGVSFHEFDLAFKNSDNLNIVSSLNRLVYSKNLINTFVYKKLYKMYLRKFTNKHKAFFEEYLDLIIQKK
ncbi:MAG: class I SAM-dependent methyltransferase, partial [Alphaproteobacteria bacterium]